MLAGCATTYASGGYDPTTGVLRVKSRTTFIGSAAGKNAKLLRFKIINGGLLVTAEGTSNTEAETSLEGVGEIVGAAGRTFVKGSP